MYDSLRYLKYDNISKIKKTKKNHIELTLSVEYRFPNNSQQFIIQVFAPQFKYVNEPIIEQPQQSNKSKNNKDEYG